MSLPPEIFDAILDHLHSDKRTLQLCALTCMAWLPACRYHLFYNITLSPSDVVSFLEFTEGSSEDLIGLVRCLSVRRSVAGGFTRGVPVTPRVMELKRQLLNLPCLKLSEVFWGVLSADQKHLLSSLPGVTHLELDRVSFDNAHTMLVFVCSFKALESLSITNWSMQKAQTGIAQFLTTSPRLSQKGPIHIHFDVLNLDLPRSITLLVQWLMDQDPVPSIRIDSLRLGPLHDHSLLTMACIQRLMSSSDTNIDHLHIKGSRITYGANAKAEYLRAFVETLQHQSVRSLSFDLILLSVPPNNTFDHFTLGIITGILTSITWCPLQHLSLSFVISEWESMLYVDWEEMEGILQQPQFNSLRRIRIAVFEIDGERNRRKLMNTVRDGLPSLSSRGLLSFEFLDEMEGRYY